MLQEMSQELYNYWNFVLAIFASVTSVISLILHIINYQKTKFNLKVFFDNRDSFYFEPLDTLYGNQESLIVKVRLANISSQPLSISDIQIGTPPHACFSIISNYPISYPEHLPDETYATLKDKDGYLLIKSVDCEGYHILDLKNKLIKCPIYLNAYESIDGFLLFPYAGVSSPKTEIRIITSRKTKVVRHTFMSKENHENSFQ